MNNVIFNNPLFQKMKLRTLATLLIAVILSSAAFAGDDCQNQNTCSCSPTGEATGSCYLQIPNPANANEPICAQTACFCTAVPKPLGGTTYMKSCGNL